MILKSSSVLLVEPIWGAMKYVRQREPSLMGEADAAVITKARDMYGEAVEASTKAAVSGQPGVVGDTVRQAFAQVSAPFPPRLLVHSVLHYKSCCC